MFEKESSRIVHLKIDSNFSNYTYCYEWSAETRAALKAQFNLSLTDFTIQEWFNPPTFWGPTALCSQYAVGGVGCASYNMLKEGRTSECSSTYNADSWANARAHEMGHKCASTGFEPPPHERAGPF